MKNNYGYKKEMSLAFIDAVIKVKTELQNEGFGILTEINVKETLKKKLGCGVYNVDIFLKEEAYGGEYKIGIAYVEAAYISMDEEKKLLTDNVV